MAFENKDEEEGPVNWKVIVKVPISKILLRLQNGLIFDRDRAIE
jgi:hypothetical protein